jgi:hypothetical protein
VLGPAYNVYFTSSNKIVPVRPAFLRYPWSQAIMTTSPWDSPNAKHAVADR